MKEILLGERIFIDAERLVFYFWKYMKTFILGTIGLLCLLTVYPLSALAGFLSFFAKEGYQRGLKEAKDLDTEMMS